MSLKYNDMNDVFRGAVLDENDGIISSSTAPCYGSFLRDSVQNALRSGRAKWYSVYINDAVTNHYKTKEKTQQFVDLIASTGLLRYTTVSWVEKLPECLVRSGNNSKGFFLELRTDIRKSSAQEMFLVGTVMRTLALQPQVITSFLRLHKWFGDKIETSILFVIANSLTFHKAKIYNGRGHKFVDPAISYVTGKTFADALKVCENHPPLNKIVSAYPYTIGQETFFSVCHYIRRGGSKYSKGILESYLSEAGYNSWVDNPKFCRER